MCRTKALLRARVGLQAYPTPRATHLQLSGIRLSMFLRTGKARIHARLKECAFSAGSSQCCYRSFPSVSEPYQGTGAGGGLRAEPDPVLLVGKFGRAPARRIAAVRKPQLTGFPAGAATHTSGCGRAPQMDRLAGPNQGQPAAEPQSLSDRSTSALHPKKARVEWRAGFTDPKPQSLSQPNLETRNSLRHIQHKVL